MKKIIDYKGLLHVCDTVDVIHEQRRYLIESLKNVKKDIVKDTATIDLDTYMEVLEFLEEDLLKLSEDIRNKAKRMENKLQEYKMQQQ